MTLLAANDLQDARVRHARHGRDRTETGSVGVGGLDRVAPFGVCGLTAFGGPLHAGERVSHLAVALVAPRLRREVPAARAGLLRLPCHVVGPLVRALRIVGHGLLRGRDVAAEIGGWVGEKFLNGVHVLLLGSGIHALIILSAGSGVK